MSNEKPVTISELQKILEDGNPRHIEILPDGSLMAHECVCNSCESLRTQLDEARKRVEDMNVARIGLVEERDKYKGDLEMMLSEGCDTKVCPVVQERDTLRTQLGETRKRVEELDAQLRQLQDAVVNPSQPPREI